VKIAGTPKVYADRSRASGPAPVAHSGAPVQQVTPGVLSVQNLDPITQALLANSQQQVERAREESRYVNDMLLRAMELAGKQQPAAPVDPSGSLEAMREMRAAMKELREMQKELEAENMKLRRQAAGQPREKQDDGENTGEALMGFAVRQFVSHAAPILAREVAPGLAPRAKKLIEQMVDDADENGAA
jgi:hypothetical protein